MSLSPRHERDAAPIPAHPYRDTAILYAILAVAIVVVVAITGGDLLQSLLVAAGFWLLATAWAWWRFRQRIRARDAAEAEQAQANAGANGGR